MSGNAVQVQTVAGVAGPSVKLDPATGKYGPVVAGSGDPCCCSAPTCVTPPSCAVATFTLKWQCNATGIFNPADWVTMNVTETLSSYITGLWNGLSCPPNFGQMSVYVACYMGAYTLYPCTVGYMNNRNCEPGGAGSTRAGSSFIGSYPDYSQVRTYQPSYGCYVWCEVTNIVVHACPFP